MVNGTGDLAMIIYYTIHQKNKWYGRMVLVNQEFLES